jgi:hypothetical protein
VYENIKSLRPYFWSLREVEATSVSLDIKLPLTWKYEKIIAPYSGIKFKIQDKNDKYTLISLVAPSTKEGYSLVFSCANEVILFNKQEEEKKILYEEKVRELQILFQSQTLDKLKDIKLINEYGQRDTTGIRMVEQGDGEGSNGNTEEQEEDDRRDIED